MPDDRPKSFDVTEDDLDTAFDGLERGEKPVVIKPPEPEPPPDAAPPTAPSAALAPAPAEEPKKPVDRRRLYQYWTKAEVSSDEAEPGPASPALFAAPIQDEIGLARLLGQVECNYLRYAGYVDQTPVPEIVGRVMMGRENGHLLLRRGEISKCISFVAGDPVFATSNLDADRVGEVIVRTGRASKDRVDHAREYAKSPEQLVEELAIADVASLLRDGVASILDSIFEWRSGEFSFVRLALAEQSRVSLGQPAPVFLVAGIRRHFAKPEILRRLRGEMVVPVPTVLPLPDPDRLGLEPAERDVLPLIDGKNHVGKILEELPRSGTVCVLYALVCLGAVRVRLIV